MSLVQSLNELVFIIKVLHIIDFDLSSRHILANFVQSLVSKVLGWGLIRLDRLQVLDDVVCSIFLLVNNALEVLVFLVDFHGNFLVQAHLVYDFLLHVSTLIFAV
jgi:hypothetical protein